MAKYQIWFEFNTEYGDPYEWSWLDLIKIHDPEYGDSIDWNTLRITKVGE